MLDTVLFFFQALDNFWRVFNEDVPNCFTSSDSIFFGILSAYYLAYVPTVCLAFYVAYILTIYLSRVQSHDIDKNTLDIAFSHFSKYFTRWKPTTEIEKSTSVEGLQTSHRVIHDVFANKPVQTSQVMDYDLRKLLVQLISFLVLQLVFSVSLGCPWFSLKFLAWFLFVFHRFAPWFCNVLQCCFILLSFFFSGGIHSFMIHVWFEFWWFGW